MEAKLRLRAEAKTSRVPSDRDHCYLQLYIRSNCVYPALLRQLILQFYLTDDSIAIITQPSTRGTVDSHNWSLHLIEKLVALSYRVLVYD
ncbi:hypothetical protein LguiB_020560 [Lonicera macranthoides]